MCLDAPSGPSQVDVRVDNLISLRCACEVPVGGLASGRLVCVCLFWPITGGVCEKLVKPITNGHVWVASLADCRRVYLFRTKFLISYTMKLRTLSDGFANVIIEGPVSEISKLSR